jgi:hypothetical protein
MRADDLQALGTQLFRPGGTDEERHVPARLRETPAEVSAGRPGSHDQNAHGCSRPNEECRRGERNPGFGRSPLAASRTTRSGVRPDLSKLSTQQLLTLPLNALRLSARGCVGNLPLRFDGNVEVPRFRAVEPTIQPMRLAIGHHIDRGRAAVHLAAAGFDGYQPPASSTDGVSGFARKHAGAAALHNPRIGAVEPSRIPFVDGLAAAATVRGFGSQLGRAAFLN